METPGARCALSLYFFGDYPDSDRTDRYRPVLSAARFADRHGLHAIWLPERHFHSFGGLFPNPAVLAAAVAAVTSRLRLCAGSVVLPLHNPIRVAEEWSVVDNLSGGRVGLCVASGWHSHDFVLAPGNYGRHKDLMYEQLDTVRALWAGRRIAATAGDGSPVEVELFPKPVQVEPPLFTAVVDNPDSYRRAAAAGLGVVTNLMTQGVPDLARNVALYRRTRAEHGLDPAGGRVVVLLHCYLGPDEAAVRAAAYGPFKDYLRSSLSLLDRVTNSLGVAVDLGSTPPDDVDFLLSQAYERYCADRALIGTPAGCRPVVDAVVAAGANEIACFVDFGVPEEAMLAGLPAIVELRDRQLAPPAPSTPRLASPTTPAAPAPGTAPTPSAALGAGTPLGPAAAAQRRLWVLDRMGTDPRAYREPKALLIEGELDPDRLRAALAAVVARQPALRTVFREVDGEPHRLLLPPTPVDCPVVDRPGGSQRAVRALLADLDDTRFDLAAGPLLRVRLARLAADRHLLFVLVHHIVFDSMSTAVLARDLAACYRAWPDPPADLPELPEPPADAPATGDRAGGIAFWTGALAGVPVPALPPDRPRPARPSGRGAAVVRELAPDVADRVEGYAREQGATPFMVLLAAVAATIGRFSGQQDVVLGTAVTDRPPGTEDLVGMYVGTVPIRLDLTGDPGFAELVRRVRSASTAAYEHQDVPFEEIVSAVNPRRVPGGNPLFQVMVEYEAAPAPDTGAAGLAIRSLEVPSDRAPFDLTLYLSRHPAGLRCTVEYATDLFEAPTVHRLLQYVEAALAAATGPGPDVPLSALTAPTGQDRALLAAWQGRRVTDRPTLLHEPVDGQIARTPAAPAVRDGDRTVPYGELGERADRLARRLARLGLAAGDRVAVCLPRGADLVGTLLGVLRAGGVYVPIDPQYPVERVRTCVELSGARLLVAGAAFRAEHPGAVAVPVLDGADGTADPAGLPGGPVPDPAQELAGPGPDALAYCIFTSGSTGRPNAVAVPHRGPANLVRWFLAGREPMRTLLWTSPAFDVSVQEIVTTLAAGGVLVTCAEDVRRDPDAVVALLRSEQVERLFMPCTPLTQLLGRRPELPRLREVYCAGERVVLTAEVRRFFAAHPAVRLVNQYGPTEASIVVTSHEVDVAAETAPPIGRPVDGVELRLLDRHGPVPIGVAGELHLGGVPVAAGYLGEPGLTARRFGPDPEQPGRRLYRTGDLARWRFDGELEFLGRTDDQVKIRGFRVEPAEVEVALDRLDGVRAARVVARRDEVAGTARLVAYVVPADGTASDTDLVPGLRSALRRMLPAHLVPDAWQLVDELPVTPNGKLDTHRLPDPLGPPPGPPPGPAPGTPTEQAVHELWCAELRTDAVPPDRDFFDAGGNSMLAVRLLDRVRERFGSRYPMADFLGTPTIEAMAARLARPVP